MILCGIGVALVSASVWLFMQYGRLASAQSVSLREIPLTWLFMPEIDIETGEWKSPHDGRADNLANRVLLRIAGVGKLGVVLIVGGPLPCM